MSIRPITPWTTNAPAFTEDETQKKWIVWNTRAYQIGDMYPTDYRKWVQSHCTTVSQAREILGKIDTFDDATSRWWCVLELLYRDEHKTSRDKPRHKIVLYDSRAEAERAMRGVA